MIIIEEKRVIEQDWYETDFQQVRFIGKIKCINDFRTIIKMLEI